MAEANEGDPEGTGGRTTPAEGVRWEALSHDEWDALARLWGEIAHFPLGQAEEATRYSVVRLCTLLGASLGGLTLVSRGGQPADRHIRLRALSGWRPVLALAMTRDGARLDEGIDPILRSDDYVDDPLVQLTLSATGRRRAFLRSDALDDDKFWGSPMAATLELFGSSDRLLGVQPLRSDLEAVFSLDRPRGAARFTVREKKLLLEALRGLEPAFVALARWAGYLDAKEPLTPKERLVLGRLLTGRREADIAAELEMGRRSLHQRVVDVYRKFGVSSRPQLMALWLSSSSGKDD